MKSKIIFSLGFVWICLLLLTGRGRAQDPTPAPRIISDDQVNAIAKQMFCPVCENTPLDVCPTQACIEWRELIRDKLSEGWNEKQIKNYFVERFGDRVLASPPARGMNWLVYVIPPIAFLAGAYILYRAFKSWQVPPAEVSHPEENDTKKHDDPYLDRLEDELKKL